MFETLIAEVNSFRATRKAPLIVSVVQDYSHKESDVVFMDYTIYTDYSLDPKGRGLFQGNLAQIERFLKWCLEIENAIVSPRRVLVYK